MNKSEHVLTHFLPSKVLVDIRGLSASFERDEAFRVYVLKRMWFVIPLGLLFFYVSSIYSFNLFLFCFSALGITSSTSDWILYCLLGIFAVFWFGSLMLQLYLLFMWLQVCANRDALPSGDRRETGKVWSFVGIPAWISLLLFGIFGPNYKVTEQLVSPQQFSISSATMASAFEKNVSIRRYQEDIVARLTAQATANELEELNTLGLRGTIMIRIQVRRDGSLEKAGIMWLAADDAINKAACRLINKAAPFPAFPPELREMKNIAIVRKMTFNFSKSSPELVSTRPPGRQC